MWIRVFAVLLLLSGAVQAQETKLRVGIFDRPPFAMKGKDGRWTGFAVAAWEGVSTKLSLPFDYVEVPPEQAIADTAAGRLDLTVGEIAVSSVRSKQVKFSQPFATFPESVAIKESTRFPHWIDFLANLLKHGVSSMIIVIFVTLVLFSILLWLVERRVNHAHFGGHPVRGLGSALWFTAVTMTTVGYGDKTPQSVPGRMIVFFWMFFGVVAISVFTGTVASSLAVARVETTFQNAESLSRYHNGVEEGTVSQIVLSDIGIPAKVFPTVDAGLQALQKGEITAFVGGEATLRYVVNREFPGEVLIDEIPDTHITYAFAMRPGLSQRDAIDAALIDEVTRPDWRREMQRYMGPRGN